MRHTPEGSSFVLDGGNDAADTDARAPDAHRDEEIPLPKDRLADCAPLPLRRGAVVLATPADHLGSLVAAAPEQSTILLADGHYDLSSGAAGEEIVFRTPNVTMRSQSGDPARVVLDGGYDTHAILAIEASGVSIADLTLTRSGAPDQWAAAVVVEGSATEPTFDVLLRGLVIRDPGGAGVRIGSLDRSPADRSTVACSHFELTSEGRGDTDGCRYTSAIFAVAVRDWTVRNNRFDGFWCDPSVARQVVRAVRFGYRSRDPIIEQNIFVDADLAIALGYHDVSVGAERTYADNPCPDAAGYVDHVGGIVRNNAIVTTPALPSNDSGIALWQACGTWVAHNTLVAMPGTDPYASIEWRWPGTTDVSVVNNLVNYAMRARDGAIGVSNAGNVDLGSTATLDVFREIARGDVHLTSLGETRVGAGLQLPTRICDLDMDGEARSRLPDPGADET